MTIRSNLNSSISLIAVFALYAQAVSAAEFTINTPVVVRNGGNVVDGNDTITVTTTGSITPPASHSGLESTGDSNVLTNNGAITTTANIGYGVTANGNSNMLSNTGTISTSGTFGVGLTAAGNSNTLGNSGIITTTNTNGYAMSVFGTGNNLVNSNSLMTSGTDGLGVLITGNTNTFSNSGSITTTGATSNGALAVGNNNTLSNTGTITTATEDSLGLAADGDNNTVSNSGTITTSGDDAAGFGAGGDGNTIVNTGTVTTSGSDAFGIAVGGDGSSVTTSGSVSVTGADAFGVASNGTGNTVTVSGVVASASSYSIAMVGANATLNLNAGAVLGGDIKFDTVASATLNFGAGMNAVIHTDASIPGTISAANGAYFVSGDDIYVIDSTGMTAQSQAGGNMASMISNAVNQQQQTGNVGVTRGTSLGFRTSTKGLMNPSWIKSFGSLDFNGGTTTTGAYTAGSTGLIFGNDTGDSSGYFTGVALGASASKATSFSTTAVTAFTGGYMRGQLMGLTADWSATVGVIGNANTRRIANNAVPGGFETARSSAVSFFVSPSLKLSRQIETSGGSITPSFGLTYAAIQQGGYTETGSTSNLTVGSSLSQMLKVRMQVEGAMRPQEIKGATVFAGVYAGVEAQKFWGGNVTTSLGATSVSFTSAAADAVRGFVGVNARILTKNGAVITGGAELGHNSLGSTTLTYNVKFKMTF